MRGRSLDPLKENHVIRPNETREIRIKRLQMRSMRRGMKEMDIILNRFAVQNLGTMTDDELDIYEAFLAENDQELYQWVSGQKTAPDVFENLVAKINHPRERTA